MIEDLIIQSGRLYLLTGANGSGKSTLLSILAFLTPPTRGDIYYSGVRAIFGSSRSLQKLRREVTLLHQNPYLFRQTVYGNVAYGLMIRRITGQEQERRVAEALDLVGLGGFQQRQAQELSGGEAQRVAMARALALKPKVLLLDEPLSNVDSNTAKLLEQVIVSLPKKGTSVIITSHDHGHLERLECARIHLAAGRLNGIPVPKSRSCGREPAPCLAF